MYECIRCSIKTNIESNRYRPRILSARLHHRPQNLAGIKRWGGRQTISRHLKRFGRDKGWRARSRQTRPGEVAIVQCEPARTRIFNRQQRRVFGLGWLFGPETLHRAGKQEVKTRALLRYLGWLADKCPAHIDQMIG